MSAAGDLDVALDRLERALGARRVGAVTAKDTGPLDRARRLLDSARGTAGRWGTDVRDALRRAGDKLFEFADKSSGFVAKKATELAQEAYLLVAGPALILALLWLLSRQI